MIADPAGRHVGEYRGATAEELGDTTPEEMAEAGVGQHAQFRRHGVILLTPEELLLFDWFGPGPAEPLKLRREDIVKVETRYTDLYGRFEGGILNFGKPLILDTSTVGQIYLLIDWKEFMEITHDRQWASDIQAWLKRGAPGPSGALGSSGMGMTEPSGTTEPSAATERGSDDGH